MNLLRQEVWFGSWVFLSSAEVCSYDRPLFPLNGNMWISVCWPTCLPSGNLLLLTCYRHICKCTSDICRQRKSLLSITKSHKLPSFSLAVSILFLFRHSLWLSLLPSNMGFGSCPSKVFAKNLLFLFCPPRYRSLFCSPPPTALLPGSSVPQPELTSHLQDWDTTRCWGSRTIPCDISSPLTVQHTPEQYFWALFHGFVYVNYQAISIPKSTCIWPLKGLWCRRHLLGSYIRFSYRKEFVLFFLI